MARRPILDDVSDIGSLSLSQSRGGLQMPNFADVMKNYRPSPAHRRAELQMVDEDLSSLPRGESVTSWQVTPSGDAPVPNMYNARIGMSASVNSSGRVTSEGLTLPAHGGQTLDQRTLTPFSLLDTTSGHTFGLYLGANSIGRSHQCNIVLETVDVSRLHACIYVQEVPHATEGYRVGSRNWKLSLCDFGSKWGTKVGSRKVEKGKPVHGLRLDYVVSCGASCRLRICVEEEPPAESGVVRLVLDDREKLASFKRVEPSLIVAQEFLTHFGISSPGAVLASCRLLDESGTPVARVEDDDPFLSSFLAAPERPRPELSGADALLERRAAPAGVPAMAALQRMANIGFTLECRCVEVPAPNPISVLRGVQLQRAPRTEEDAREAEQYVQELLTAPMQDTVGALDIERAMFSGTFPRGRKAAEQLAQQAAVRSELWERLDEAVEGMPAAWKLPGTTPVLE